MNKRKIIFILLIVIALIGISLSVTYSLNVLVTENTTSDYDLSYTFDISDNATWTINVEANKTKVYDISITNPYNDSIKYGVIYKLNNPTSMPDGSLVGVLNTSKYPAQDLIEKNNTREVSIAIVNNSSSNMQITLSIVNGYKNGGELIIPEGYTLVTEEYSVVPESLKTLTRLGLTANADIPDFSKTSCSSGCEETTVGLYKTEDDLGTSYYFRGDVENNYVYFAGYYWRIIRINGDGTVRMIYDGTSAHANGETSEDSIISSSAFNSSGNDVAYVGYKYGSLSATTYEEAHANTNDSTIKQVIDTWYKTNILDKGYSSYLANSIYCNDRSLYSGTGTNDNYNITNFNASNRITTLNNPTLYCKQANDKFTVINNGNGSLQYPVGLITADEVVYAGNVQGSNNSNCYLQNGNNYWTMTPASYYHNGSMNYYVKSTGTLGVSEIVSISYGVRPVITLTSDALSEGTGTMTDPFKTLPSAETTLTKLGLVANTDTPDFSKTSCSSGCDESTVGIYEAEDDLGTSYYFRGDVENNYVYFAGYYWRIIRINGDGTVRMIYDGTSAHANGESSTDRQIGTSVFNSIASDNTYAGYMYGTAGAKTYVNTHLNTNDSTIKAYIDNWYNNNIKGTTLEQYVVDAIYCNDREISSGTGIGSSSTTYKSRERLDTNKIPTLKCNQENDRFTVNTKINGITGNSVLTNPVGLITADEVAYAGGLYSEETSVSENSKYYLYTNNIFWTMTSLKYTNNAAYVIYVTASGRLSNPLLYGVKNSESIRPVITLSSTALTKGTGTMTDPFKTLSASETTLTNLGLTVNTGTPDFSKTSADDGTTGIYTAEDEFGTSYYFRGNVTNNYVYFAGYYWRIVRINGDGSIRMIYDGTSAHANGEKSDDRQIGTSRFGISNDDTAYVGYMYGKANSTTYEETHANTNDSTMKTYLDNWYNANIKNTTYEQYISDAIYCNDREVYTGPGYQYYDTDYYAYKRLITLKEPSLKCNQLNDRFTVNANLNGVTGNGKLTNPIGLITADEVSYAGSIYGGNNTSIFDFYLDIDSEFWTISPFMYNTAPFMFSVLASGSMRQVSAYNISVGVRPVISIASKSIKYGNGTSTNPFRINSIM